MENKCQCKEIMTNHNGGRVPQLYIHLSGCPEGYEAKEYNQLSWWKKLFVHNPRKTYDIHKRQTGTW